MENLPKLSSTSASGFDLWSKQVKNVLRVTEDWSETKKCSRIMASISGQAMTRINDSWDSLLAITSVSVLLKKIESLLKTDNQFLLNFDQLTHLHQRKQESIVDFSSRYKEQANILFPLPKPVADMFPPDPEPVAQAGLNDAQIAQVTAMRTTINAQKAIFEELHAAHKTMLDNIRLYTFTQGLHPTVKHAAMQVRPLTLDTIISNSSTIEIQESARERLQTNGANHRGFNQGPPSHSNRNLPPRLPVPGYRDSGASSSNMRPFQPRPSFQSAKPPLPVCRRCKRVHPFSQPCPQQFRPNTNFVNTPTQSKQVLCQLCRTYHTPTARCPVPPRLQTNNSPRVNYTVPASGFSERDTGSDNGYFEQMTQLDALMIKTDTRVQPVITITLNGQRKQTYVDTGASHSMMSLAFFTSATGKQISQHQRDTHLHLVDASNTEMNVVGYTTMILGHAEWTGLVYFIVVRDLAVDVILGLSTMTAHNMSINCGEQGVLIGGEMCYFEKRSNDTIQILMVRDSEADERATGCNAQTQTEPMIAIIRQAESEVDAPTESMELDTSTSANPHSDSNALINSQVCDQTCSHGPSRTVSRPDSVTDVTPVNPAPTSQSDTNTGGSIPISRILDVRQANMNVMQHHEEHLDITTESAVVDNVCTEVSWHRPARDSNEEDENIECVSALGTSGKAPVSATVNVSSEHESAVLSNPFDEFDVSEFQRYFNATTPSAGRNREPLQRLPVSVTQHLRNNSVINSIWQPFNDYWSSLSRIVVSINTADTIAILDTQSAVTMVQEHFWRCHNPDWFNHTEPSGWMQQTLGQRGLNVVASTTIHLQIDSWYAYEKRVLIVSNLVPTCIIGWSTMSKHNMIINLGDNTLRIGTGKRKFLLEPPNPNFGESSPCFMVPTASAPALPEITGTGNGYKLNLLVDSGSQLSLISDRMWRRIGPERSSKAKPPLYSEISGVSGQTLHCISDVSVTLRIGSWTAQVPTTVVRKLPLDYVLGIDTLRQYNMKINMAQNCLEVDNHKISFFRPLVLWPTDGIMVEVFADEPKLLPAKQPTKIIAAMLSKLPDGTHGYFEPDQLVFAKHGWVIESSPACTAGGKLLTTVTAKTQSKINADLFMGHFRVKQNTRSVGSATVKPISVAIEDMINQIKEGQQIDLSDLTALERSDRNELARLLFANRDIFSANSRDLGCCNLGEHTINTGSAPPCSKSPYRIAHSMRSEMDRQVTELLADGHIFPSNSPWRSPALLVKKKADKDGVVSWRLVIDYRQLNAVTVADLFPMCRVDDTLTELGNSAFFSTLDLSAGFWQIRVQEADQIKTQFVTTAGSFSWRVMPFGLRNSPATFQRIMNRILEKYHLQPFAKIYIDDIIIFSPTFAAHLQHISRVFNALRQSNLKIKGKKCSFVKTSVHFLGHIVSNDGVRTDPAKLSAISKYPVPKDLKALRSWLGMCGYYRRFISHYAQIAMPLYALMKKSVTYKWTDETQAAFDQLKNTLMTEPVLALPDWSLPFILQSDASSVGMGSSVQQKNAKGEIHPLAYASALFTSAQRKYTVIEQECLAIIHGITEFHYILYGHWFEVQSDHRPLQWLLSNRSTSARIERWVMHIQSYLISNIRHISGPSNKVADALSRSSSDTPFVPDAPAAYLVQSFTGVLKKDNPLHSLDKVKTAQAADPTLSQLIQWLKHSIMPTNPTADFSAMYKDRHTLVLQDGILYKASPKSFNADKVLLVVPKSMQEEVLHGIHGSKSAGHYGLHKTRSRCSERFYWERMFTDVTNWVRSCVNCATRKQAKRIVTPLHPIPVNPVFGSIWASDIVGPLPITERGNRYIQTAIEYLSKFPEAWALSDITAETTARNINELVCRYGPMTTLISDAGSQYMSDLMEQLLNVYGIEHITSSVYSPKANGLVENINKTLGIQLSLLAQFDEQNWDLHLASVLYSYRSSVHLSHNHCPFEVVYGRKPKLFTDLEYFSPETFSEPRIQELVDGLDITRKLVAENIKRAQENQVRFHDRRLNHKVFEKGDWVLLRRPPRDQPAGSSKKFQHLYTGPYEVVHPVKHTCNEAAGRRCTRSACGQRNYIIKDPATDKESLHNVERLKPFLPAEQSFLLTNKDDVKIIERVKRGVRPRARSPGEDIEVSEILDQRLHRNPNGLTQLEYLVKFVDGDTQWVREPDMRCEQVLSDWRRQRAQRVRQAFITGANPIQTARKSRSVWGIAQLFMITLLLIGIAGGEPPRVSPIGELLQCGHASQARVWSMGQPPDCQARMVGGYHTVDHVAALLYHKVEFSQSHTAVMCLRKQRTIVTRMTFLGDPILIADSTKLQPISIKECREYVGKLRDNLLTKRSESVYTEDDTMVATYSWCCRNEQQTHSHVEVVRGDVFVNFEENTLLTTLDFITSRCTYKDGFCEDANRVLLWTPKRGQACPYKPAQRFVSAEIGRSEDGAQEQIISREGQFVAFGWQPRRVCDNILTLNFSADGLIFSYYHINTLLPAQTMLPISNTSDGITDSVHQLYYLITRLRYDTRAGFHNAWLEICHQKQREYNFFKQYAIENPTLAFRTLLQRDDITAQATGDHYYIWSCARVSGYTIRETPGLCFRDLPISLGDSSPAFVRLGTREVIRESVQRDCHTGSHFVYTVQGKTYSYGHDQWTLTSHTPKTLQWNIGPLFTNSAEILNCSITYHDGTVTATITSIYALVARYSQLHNQIHSLVSESGFDATNLKKGVKTLGQCLRTSSNWFSRQLIQPAVASLMLLALAFIGFQIFSRVSCPSPRTMMRTFRQRILPNDPGIENPEANGNGHAEHIELQEQIGYL